MNDPHVVALLYDFVPEPSDDYSEAEPLRHEEAAFDLSVAEGIARFDMKEHFATEGEARQVVDRFVEKWRLYARLRRTLRPFKLKFKRSIIEDRNPTSGVVFLGGGLRLHSRFGAELTILAGEYPSPPQSPLTITPDVQSMYDRFVGYLEGREPLPSMAYFCLDVLERSAAGSGKKRPRAAEKYAVEEDVLNEIGRLTSRKGGAQARKGEGLGAELEATEIRFLKRAVGAIILRMAEMAADPDRDYPVIGMSDL